LALYKPENSHCRHR